MFGYLFSSSKKVMTTTTKTIFSLFVFSFATGKISAHAIIMMCRVVRSCEVPVMDKVLCEVSHYQSCCGLPSFVRGPTMQD